MRYTSRTRITRFTSDPPRLQSLTLSSSASSTRRSLRAAMPFTLAMAFYRKTPPLRRLVPRPESSLSGPPSVQLSSWATRPKRSRIMIEAGVACVAGYQGEDQSTKTLLREAEGIGFPLMIKAAAGGGGRGMRLVHEAKQLTAAVDLARSEAINAFGSGDLILEKSSSSSSPRRGAGVWRFAWQPGLSG